MRQFGTVGFVALNTTFLIQNISYPEGVEPWKRTFKASVGFCIFLAGFAVAKVLFDFYQAQLRAANRSPAAACPEDLSLTALAGEADGSGVKDGPHGAEDRDASGEGPANGVKNI
jgi:hypothetical protein